VVSGVSLPEGTSKPASVAIPHRGGDSAGRGSLEQQPATRAPLPVLAQAFDVADEIAHNVDPIDFGIGDARVGELSFDDDQQLETVEPIGTQIRKANVVGDAFDVDSQMLGNEGTNIAVGVDYPRGV
jgi:hypothetical protein